MENIILIGFGGHCKSIIDTIETSTSYKIYGIIDIEDKIGQVYKKYSVIGTDEDLKKFFELGITKAFICIGYLGNSNIRNNLYFKLKQIGFTLPNIIDKTAILASNIKLGDGNFIGKRAVLNSDVSIGNMCIINTGAILEHETSIDNFSHISVGSVLCGNVKINDNVFIGANTTIIQGVKIGSNSIIGAGSLILNNVLNNSKKYGIIK